MEYELDYILFAIKDIDINPSTNEVKDYAYVSRDKISQFLSDKKSKGEQTTPWFQLLLDDKLFKWWDLLLQGKTPKDLI